MSPSPLMLHAVMSAVNGNAVAQPGSSSSLKPCGPVSAFNVTTQVLLRSGVASPPCPHPGRAAQPRQHGGNDRYRPSAHQRALAGVSATGVSGGFPANQV